MADAQDEMFKSFKEYSVAEFFKKNRQMLGFSGKVRSLTTIVHEYVTNGLDACEEAGILPEISVEINELGEDHYSVMIQDNGPGIPKTHIGKALGTMLAGTKFHRYMQQRGQQGIGATGCTMYALITTGKPIQVKTGNKGKVISCDLSVDFKSNSAVMGNLMEEQGEFQGLMVKAEFKDVKYEKSNYGVYEYLRRTALANPHATIRVKEPNGDSSVFPRAVDTIPPRPHEIKPHPLGINAHDLLEFAKAYRGQSKLSVFMEEVFSRFSHGKANEVKALLPEIDFEKKPKDLTWEESEKLINAFKQLKWISPETDAVIPVGKDQITKSFMNIFNPEIISVTQRPPKIFRGGIPFVVEVGLAFGGGVESSGKRGEVMRFANRVPLPFDAGGCAITEAVKSVEWRRYDLKNFEEEPIVLLVNLSSVYIPYVSAGKQAVSPEEDIVAEIKNAVMETARDMQRYLSGKRRAKETETKKKLLERYVDQLATDLASLANEKKEPLKKGLEEIIVRRYATMVEEEHGAEPEQKLPDDGKPGAGNKGPKNGEGKSEEEEGE
ncbi:MAG: DNA topoisomerase VI subunit B [Candidatus Bilamarchaeaceae archaeon]